MSITRVSFQKLPHVSFRKFTRTHYFLLSSGVLGITVVLVVTTDWISGKDALGWMLAIISWAKEALDSARHLLEVMEETSEL